MKHVFWTIWLLFISNTAFAQTATEIVKKSEELLKGDSSRGRFMMTVTTPDYTRKMEMESWWVGNDKALIVIKSPKREAGNKTLKIGNEMWSYLKNTETTIKIPPSMMLQSWNGSDFTNDDLVRESNLIEDYDLSLAGEGNVDEEECWKIELVPNENAPVVWGRLYYWVRKSDYLPAWIEYYDEKGTLIRTMHYSDYQIMDNRKVPTRWVMESQTKDGHQTEFAILDMEYDIKISDRIFSFRELERGN